MGIAIAVVVILIVAAWASKNTPGGGGGGGGGGGSRKVRAAKSVGRFIRGTPGTDGWGNPRQRNW